MLGTELRNKIGGFVAGYSMVSFGLSFLVVTQWAHLAPKSPNPVLGLVFQHNEHGSITYFSAFQATSSALLFWISFIGIVLAIAISPKRDVKTRRLAGLPLGASWQRDDPAGLAKSRAKWGAAVALLLNFVLGPILVSWLNSHGIVFNL